VKNAKHGRMQSAIERRVMARVGRVDLECDRTWGRWRDAGEWTLLIGDFVNKLLHKISSC
jgi:hypothetical protein